MVVGNLHNIKRATGIIIYRATVIVEKKIIKGTGELTS